MPVTFDVMLPESTTTVRVRSGYVVRMLAIAIAAASAPLIVLIVFLFHVEGAVFLALLVATVVTIGMLAVILGQTYRAASHQAIHLHPHKIVFDYMTGAQAFEFLSPNDWQLDERGANWVMVSCKDGSSKTIPKSAFPSLREDVRAFYQAAT